MTKTLPQEYKVTEYRLFYGSTKKHPKVMRFEIRMRDAVDLDTLQKAVHLTMQRYPYFCVELVQRDGEYYFQSNPREVVVKNTDSLLELNSAETNFHQLYFGCHEDWLTVNIFHVLTDGDGAYALMRTLLYYYVSQKYQVTLSQENIRLEGDEIPDEEIENPLDKLESINAQRTSLDPVFIIDNTSPEPILHHIKVDEEVFIRQVKAMGATPNALVSLLLCKAIYRHFHLTNEKVRVTVCINERKALKAPLAHQSLVGGALLDYGPEMNAMEPEEAAKSLRASLKEQAADEAVLHRLAAKRALEQYVYSCKGDDKRCEIVLSIIKQAYRVMTASVSYVGKANFGDAEKYIEDFITMTCPNAALLAELSAVNGKLYLDLLQDFRDEAFIHCFLEELDSLGVDYEWDDEKAFHLANVQLPWDQK